MKKAELIFVPTPGIGHLVSTIEFAKRLINRDDRILITVLVMKPSWSAQLTEYTESCAASEPRIQFIDLPLVEPPPAEIMSKSVESFITLSIESHIPPVRDALTNIVSTRSSSDSVRVAGLVLDFFCVSMVDVADELGLPSYIFLTSNVSFLSLMLSLVTRHSQRPTEFTESDSDFIIPSFANSVPPRVLPLAVFNKDGGYAAYIKVAQRFRDTKGIIVNTFAELEAYGVKAFSDGQVQSPPLYTVGPVLDLKGQAHPITDRASHDKLIKWLDDQPPASVVFLCFGSMGGFGAPQVREMALALERSGYRFLWSLRAPAAETKSPAMDMLPEGFMERIGGRGMICGWAPQVEVLAHKAIGGFVSHCGWNSILESLWNQVPIVTWPLYAEQQLNAFQMVKELGLAVEMRLDYRRGGDLVMADEIESAVRRLMDGDGEVRKRVKEMGAMARDAVMDGGSSFISIGRLIQDMIGKC